MDFISNNFRAFTYGSLIGTGLFALYVEFAPGLGKVFIRPDTNNQPIFTLGGFFNLMKAPLHNIYLWKPENLDINYIFVAITSGLSGVLLKNL